jgi:hypothetical protein
MSPWYMYIHMYICASVSLSLIKMLISKNKMRFLQSQVTFTDSICAYRTHESWQLLGVDVNKKQDPLILSPCARLYFLHEDRLWKIKDLEEKKSQPNLPICLQV